jgi:hypothetical protein
VSRRRRRRSQSWIRVSCKSGRIPGSEAASASNRSTSSGSKTTPRSRAGTGGRSGLAVAISRRADATLRALTRTQARIARRILLRLVSFGEGRSDTRRQQPLSALRAAGDHAADFDAVVRHLVEHRLLTIDRDGDGDDARIDLAHEVMITAWPTLANWIQIRAPTSNIGASWNRPRRSGPRGAAAKVACSTRASSPRPRRGARPRPRATSERAPTSRPSSRSAGAHTRSGGDGDAVSHGAPSASSSLS